ncbi:CocE/NonD family hydrolase [Sphingomonas sp. MMS24-JH45]
MRTITKLLGAVAAASLAASAPAQDYAKYGDAAIDRALGDTADVEMIAMVPMRDGVGLATNIYRPKGAKGPLPTILWKTPYNELAYRTATSRRALEAVKRGYAFVVQSERGRYFSEGKYEITGYPQTDGYDTLDWIAKQRWSNGKVGTLGCSSSAEWQLALAGMNHPAHAAAMVPMAAGAGIGKVASRNRGIGTPAACPGRCSTSGSTASTTRCARSFPPGCRTSRPGHGSRATTTSTRRSRTSTGRRRSGTCPMPTC